GGNGIREHSQFKSNLYVPGLGFTAVTATFSPPILDAPAIATMGLSITSSGTMNYSIPAALINSDLSYTTSATLEAFETITVPVGTFNAVRVKQSVNLSGFVQGNQVNQSTTGTVWVVSGIGTVKSVALSGDVITRLLTSTSLATDATPDAFSLAPQTGVPIGSLVTSNAVTVSGINAPASIGITAGEYSINGGSYTSAPGTVNNRDTVTVRLVAANTYGSTRFATLIIGGNSGTFTVVTVADTSAPSVPIGLGADPVSTAQINLTWSASTDNAGVTAYQVYRGGTLIATLAAVTAYSDTGLTPSTLYSYTVQACDAASNCSAQSSPVSVTTQAIPDTQAPTIPAGLTAAAVSSVQINLTWSAATDNVGVTQYKVYRDGALIATLNAPITGYGDSGLIATTLHSYAVAACDAAGNCSVPSSPSATTTLAAGSASFTPSLAKNWNLLGNSLNITLDVAALFGNASAPVAGVSSSIASLWKWDAASGAWAFYSPRLSAAQISAYAASKGYLVLSNIGPGEGYWINAATPFSLPVQSGAAFIYSNVNYQVLPPLWNLIATAQNVYPTAFANSVSALAPPAVGVSAADTFVSLWAWDAAQAAWYYYSPVLENTTGAQGGLIAVKNFAASKGYLHFQDYTKKLDVGTGFWVNKP
ncbi:MAG TPA: fibronectin type III domain-containing protein, partial [Burkholderiales bacterium]